jgi:hypothetical protein
MRYNVVLPLPGFVLHPLTAVIVAAGHLWPLIGGEVQWTHIWKGFGALGGAYVFTALASRELARHEGRRRHAGPLEQGATRAAAR